MIDDLEYSNKEKRTIGLRNGVTIRLSPELRSRIDKYSDEHNQTRTDFFEIAAEYLLNSKLCIFCGKRNSGESKECYNCHKELFSDDELADAISSLSREKAKEFNLPFGDDNGYFYKFIPRFTIKPNNQREYYLDSQLMLPNGEIAHIERLKRIPISKDELIKAIEEAKQ